MNNVVEHFLRAKLKVSVSKCRKMEISGGGQAVIKLRGSRAMNRTGIAAVAMGVTLSLQGCIFVPYGNENSYDPFFFNPDDKTQSADFVEVGNYLPNASVPPAASRQCSMDGDGNRVGSACWFFPVMRVY